MIKAEDFKWLDRVYHLFHLGSYLCLSGELTDCFLPFVDVITNQWLNLLLSGPNNQIRLKYYILKLTPVKEKLTVETDYLPCINFNGIIRAFCYCYAK